MIFLKIWFLQIFPHPWTLRKWSLEKGTRTSKFLFDLIWKYKRFYHKINRSVEKFCIICRSATYHDNLMAKFELSRLQIVEQNKKFITDSAIARQNGIHFNSPHYPDVMFYQ